MKEQQHKKGNRDGSKQGGREEKGIKEEIVRRMNGLERRGTDSW